MHDKFGIEHVEYNIHVGLREFIRQKSEYTLSY